MTGVPIGASALVILGILLALSLLSVGVIVSRTIALSGVMRGRKARAEALRHLAADDVDAARLSLPEGDAAPQASILRDGIAQIRDDRLVGFERILETRGNEAATGFFARIRLLETAAMVSPLLGLLGTVLGMIQAFRDLEMAGGAANASLLAGGIWQALLTTAAGLVVALPAAVAASMLSSRAEAATAETEAIIGHLLAAAEDRRQ